jgi:ABC-type branched-subunit amino acid transport system permease subunit
MEVLLRTVLIGLVTGSIYALASTGLVLTYKTSGILNLGYGGLALFTTFIHWQFTIEWGWPTWLSALVVVLLIAPAIGVFLDVTLFRRLEGQPIVIGVIATVGLYVLLLGIVFVVFGSETREVVNLFPTKAIKIPGGARIGVDRLLVLAVAGAAAGLLAAMLRFTRLGVAFRAVVDNRPVAGLMAINTGFVSAAAWALGTSFAALTGILLAPRLLLDPNLFPIFIIAFVLGAAMLGYLRSLPLAFAGGLLIGLIQSFLVQYVTFGGFVGNIGAAAPFVLMTVLVLLAPKALRRAGLGASFIVRTRESGERAPAPVRLAVAAVVFGGLALVPTLVHSIGWRLNLTTGLVLATLYLSIVILTGFSGQISLGHTAFMGIGSFATAHLAASSGMSVWVALILGSLAAVPAGALIGFVAVRVHGLYLALMTLGFAFMAQQFFFQTSQVSGREGVLRLGRPEGFEGDNAFYYLALIVLVAGVIVAANLKSGRTGRVLGAIRDSETATRSLGINVAKYKVVIFSLSAFLAAISGALTAMQRGQVTRLDFIPFLSIFVVTIAVVGGVFHIGGAVAAGMLTAVFNFYGAKYRWIGEYQLIFFGFGATYALANNPEALIGELHRAGLQILQAFRRSKRAGPRAEPAPVAGGQE